ncbi:MAG TPA: hypothetical protein VIM12_13710 [Noviherbaspirillum sp.]|jgi:hypothetical protein|uniref:hypothetical protein n=1 Tax=Noviherbaspirillum sp. TaxID=1926288 RepID=UPI002F940C78
MKIDVYNSKTIPEYSILVPAGRTLDGFDDAVEKTIKILAPFELQHAATEFDAVAQGDVLLALVAQLEEYGAALMKIEVEYRLVARDDQVVEEGTPERLAEGSGPPVEPEAV